MRVLVIEGNRGMAFALRVALEAMGCRVAVAHSGRRGSACLAATAYDVVLLDLALPDLAASGLLPAIRRRRGTMRLGVVSADAEDRVRHRAGGVRAEAVLVKPFGLAGLASVVRRLAPPGAASRAWAARRWAAPRRR